jgi:O-antigen/teichoic acid export membrane protein
MTRSPHPAAQHTDSARAADPGWRGFGRTVAIAALFNIVGTVAAGVAGLVVARALGSTARGEYAAVMAWFSVLLVVGTLGQTAATTFYVASDPERGAAYLATSRRLVTGSWLVVLSGGLIVLAVLTPTGEAVVWAHRLMLMTCLFAFIGVTYSGSLQASNISAWNIVRFIQPATFAVAIVVLHLTGHLSLLSALLATSVTMAAQTITAHYFCRSHRLTYARADRTLVPPLLRFGIRQLAASGPALLIGKLDQLVLSVAVAPSLLGPYAVAGSLSSLIVPIVAAVGFVAFPRVAAKVLSRSRTDALQRWAIAASAVAGAVWAIVLCLAAPSFVPLVFGPEFHETVVLVWLLAPGGLLIACGQVCGDLLRGYGLPMAVARAQALGAAVLVLLIAMFLPTFGVPGVAVAASTAPGIALAHMLRSLWRRR